MRWLLPRLAGGSDDASELGDKSVACFARWVSVNCDFSVRSWRFLRSERPPTDHRVTMRHHTPIKHVIVIIGENRSFDHVFATYVPKPGEQVWNLLSEGIIKADGTPGPNMQKAEQQRCRGSNAGRLPSESTQVILPEQRFASSAGWRSLGLLCEGRQSGSCRSVGKRAPIELLSVPDLRRHRPDIRNSRPQNFRCQLAAPGSLSTDERTRPSITTPMRRVRSIASIRCGSSWIAVRRTRRCENPSGCDAGLFPWVEVTVGAGTNGVAQPSNFSTEYSSAAKTTGEGSSVHGLL